MKDRVAQFELPAKKGRLCGGGRSGLPLSFLLFTLAAVASAPYRQDAILVQPKSGVQPEALAAFHSAHASKVLHRFANLGGLQLVAVPLNETVSDAIARYQRSGLVAFAEPDYEVHAASTVPNDPKYLDGTLWGLNAIHAPEGWDVQNSASNTVVAVVDTGVRYTHQDLTANMWVSPLDGSHGTNVLAGTTDPNDINGGHGTMVAGVLGAVGSNAVGVVGVAWHVQIMACKSFDSFGAGTISSAVAGLDYALANNARLVNASWGFATNSFALSNALWSLRTAGIIVVAAAGNSTNDLDLNPNYPAGYHLDNVVTVAYTMRNDTLAIPSNYGLSSVQLAAPGDQIYSTFAATDSFYLAGSGSSFAAPYVTGALALLLEKFPADTYQQIIARLLNATDPLPSLAGKCATGGRLNVANALRESIQLRALATAPDGSLQLRVLGNPNRSFVLQTTSDLAAWTPILTNSTSNSGTFDFTDQVSAGLARRFYRAVALP
ncbi:MAG TPA: S8 family peptidase [Candidatus Acidoferrum sp.]|nr:S8 family peptidase [Candidatus Acidoferrum sp.]